MVLHCTMYKDRRYILIQRHVANSWLLSLSRIFRRCCHTYTVHSWRLFLKSFVWLAAKSFWAPPPWGQTAVGRPPPPPEGQGGRWRRSRRCRTPGPPPPPPLPTRTADCRSHRWESRTGAGPSPWARVRNGCSRTCAAASSPHSGTPPRNLKWRVKTTGKKEYLFLTIWFWTRLRGPVRCAHPSLNNPAMLNDIWRKHREKSQFRKKSTKVVELVT